MPPSLPAGADASLLQPWFSALVAMDLHPEIDEHYAATLEDPAPLWIKWTYAREAAVELRTRMFEAIELFVLLASADPQGWRDTVEQLVTANPYRRPLYPWADALESRPQRQVSGYDIECVDQEHVLHLQQYLASEQEPEDDIGREFMRARAVLEAGRQKPVVIPVRLRIKSSLHHLLHFDDVFPSIAEFAMAQSSIRSTQSNCRFARLRSHVRELHEPDCLMRAKEQSLSHFLAIHTHGIRICTLPALAFELNSSNALVVMQTLNTLLGAGGVTSVNFGDYSTSLPVWSAVVNSRVDRIYYRSSWSDTVVVNHRHAIQWFAYAAFRAREPTTTPKAISCRSFSREEMQWIREILVADDPLTVLFEDDRESLEEFKLTRISTSRVSLFEPRVAGEDASTSHPMELNELRVLKRNGEWWTVLVPGWGRGWVHDSNAVVTTKQIDSPTCEYSLLALELSTSDDDSREEGLELLQLVGTMVVSLRVSDKNGPGDTWFPAIFRLCPNIAKLCLDPSFQTPVRFAPLLDSFASGLCPKLTDLSMSFDILAYETCGDFGMLLRALADKSHAMARQLDTLHIAANNLWNGEDFIDSDAHDAALQALKNNTHLTLLHMNLPLATSTPERVPAMEEEFAKHHNVQLPEGCVRFTSSEKAAFLSVAWGQDDRQGNTGRERCALQQLDAAVIANVFQYVTRPRHRLVEITMPQPVRHDHEEEE